jgi:Skp family chaperone for outer membrane proteins
MRTQLLLATMTTAGRFRRHARGCTIWAALLSALLCCPGSAQGESRPVVAVFEVEAKGFDLKATLRSSLTSYLATKISESGLYEVVPQAKIKEALIAKKRESYKQCYEQSCQIEIGREMAASKSLATQVMKVGTKCVVTSNLYDLRKATAERAASWKGPCSADGILATIEEVATRLTRQNLRLMVEPVPSTPTTPPAPPPAPASSPAAPTNVTQAYFVDLGVVMNATSDGKRAKQELKQLFDRYQAEVSTAHAELKAANAAAKTPEAKKRAQEKFAALQQLYRTRQKQLKDREASLTASIAKRLGVLLDRSNKGGERGFILDLAQYVGISPEWARKTCDQSGWLVASYDRGDLLPFQHQTQCRFRGAPYVVWEKVLAQTKEVQTAREPLQKKFRELQAILDGEQQRLRKLQAAGDKEQAQQALVSLQKKYLTFQKELQDMEASSARRLDPRLSEQLRKAAASAGPVLLLRVQRGSKLPPPLAPNCDASDWAIRVLNGQATPDELRRFCPTVIP